MVYKPTFLLLIILITSTIILSSSSSNALTPKPTPWPLQFHSLLIMNTNGTLQITNLWYDWINGRNFNIILNQLANKVTYDLEWNNGTSYYYTKNLIDSDDHDDDDESECKVLHFPVGILRPNWLDGADYVGQKNVDGFLCNVWKKVDFITYFEDVLTKRPVHWIFFTGMTAHVMTFEVGAVLDDAEWQAPSNCFTKAPPAEKIPLLESMMVNDGSHSSLMRRFLNAF